jgi:hypothetical protein
LLAGRCRCYRRVVAVADDDEDEVAAGVPTHFRPTDLIHSIPSKHFRSHFFVHFRFTVGMRPNNHRQLFGRHITSSAHKDIRLPGNVFCTLNRTLSATTIILVRVLLFAPLPVSLSALYARFIKLVCLYLSLPINCSSTSAFYHSSFSASSSSSSLLILFDAERISCSSVRIDS